MPGWACCDHTAYTLCSWPKNVQTCHLIENAWTELKRKWLAIIPACIIWLAGWIRNNIPRRRSWIPDYPELLIESSWIRQGRGEPRIMKNDLSMIGFSPQLEWTPPSEVLPFMRRLEWTDHSFNHCSFLQDSHPVGQVHKHMLIRCMMDRIPYRLMAVQPVPTPPSPNVVPSIDERRFLVHCYSKHE